MAPPLDSLNLLEVCRVTPLLDSPISSPSEFIRPLTLFDTIWLKFAPAERVFFFRLPESTRPHFDSVIVPRLKHALSLTLIHYFPLAGHLTWPEKSPKPVISYTRNDGVSFTVVESFADFDRLTAGGTIPAVELHPLVPRLDSSEDKSDVVSLQVTLFPNRGFSIGITINHALLDGISVTLFTKSWAYTCRKISNDLTEKHVPLPEDLIPFYDASLIKDPTRLDMFFLNQWRALAGSAPGSPEERNMTIPHQLGTIPSDIVRSTFKFTPGDVATLRAKIQSNLDPSKKDRLHLSTYVVLVAYMSVCMVRCKKESDNRHVFLFCTGDFRNRLDPPLPATYFGNCVCGSGRTAKAASFMGEKGFGFAAELLSEAVKSVNEGVVREFDFSEIFGSLFISVAGSPRFKVYDSDFGWGKPDQVDVVSVDRSGAISMNDSPDVTGGVEASLALKTHEMEIFTHLLADGLKN